MFDSLNPVKLPGYEMTVKNTVYTRPSGLFVSGEATEGREVLVLQRYTSPTENDIVGHFQESAREILRPRSLTFRKVPPTHFEMALCKVPQEFLRKIVNGDGDITDDIKSATPFFCLGYGDKPNSYVTAIHFVLSDDELLFGGREGYIKASESVSSKKFGRRWGFNLHYTNSLPERHDIDFMLRNGIEGLSFKIYGGLYSVEDVTRVLDALYAGLKDIRDVEKLPDDSDALLDQEALDTFRRTLKFISSINFAGREGPDSSDSEGSGVEDVSGDKKGKKGWVM
ncbi:MAG: hypothetical protein WC613_04040 [Candidatus Aenigmatarchaeota archaeon]